MLSDITFLQVLTANLVVLVGACLQGVAGYGIGTLSAPLLFLVNPVLIPGPLVMNATLLNLLMLVRHRMGVSVREVRLAVGGGVLGTILAAGTLLVISPRGFELIFGVLILLAVALSVGGWKPRLNGRNSVVAGAASTYMGTITAVGGPPIALIYQNEKGALVRANMSAFFMFASVLSIAALVGAGYLGVNELSLFLATAPGVILGFLMSRWFVGRLPSSRLRPVILAIAAVAGAAALVRGILPMLST